MNTNTSCELALPFHVFFSMTCSWDGGSLCIPPAWLPLKVPLHPRARRRLPVQSGGSAPAAQVIHFVTSCCCRTKTTLSLVLQQWRDKFVVNVRERVWKEEEVMSNKLEGNNLLSHSKRSRFFTASYRSSQQLEASSQSLFPWPPRTEHS